ncbi:hypothetical protein KJ359_001182 [Pestalotiopsis sp. 9143b]|nr:hypothetical protein KJ359_001182 [Pestalotiopsis sp. 9143b]
MQAMDTDIDITAGMDFDPDGAQIVSKRPMKSIEVVDPSPRWAESFVSIAQRIQTALGDIILGIEHVGSTSIPIAAKDVIDIDLVVKDPRDEGAYVQALENAGFQFLLRDPDWHDHRLFGLAEPYANLYLAVEYSLALRSHLKFARTIMASTIEPYQIAVPEADIEKLKSKLALATLPRETSYSDEWKYGTPLGEIKRLVHVWQNSYDWRKAEAELNELPHFMTTISVDGHEDALNVHFVHQKGKKANSIPILLCHGLTQGGDWGFPITRAMDFLYPDHVLASHLNFIMSIPPSLISTPLLVLQYLMGRYTPNEKAGLKRTQWFQEEGMGYNQIQGTKPHTIGFALADSPVALLAWLYEKLHEWTDSYPWTDEEILTWISIYYFSTAGADASVRLYYEITHPTAAADNDSSLANRPIEGWMKWNAVPLGLSYFPKDVIVLPSSWGRTLGPVVYEKRHEGGGHFAAWERPEQLVADVRQTVQNAKAFTFFT